MSRIISRNDKVIVPLYAIIDNIPNRYTFDLKGPER